jgi:farnesyl-diphosphate farnesyltransferase
MTAELNNLLQATARSFYLTLRVLPGAVRPQIGLAYLLARTTDTIADTALVPLDQRLAALQKLRERILSQSTAPLNFGEFAKQQGSPAEKLLLETVEDSLAALQQCSAKDQKLIRDVLAIITGGQELDLRRFEKATALPEGGTAGIVALETAAELDDYTWRVAGCVGEFWSKLCRAHLFPEVWLNDDEFTANSIRFGKGLQLVNILRDLPVDWKRGRCYLPREKLEAAKLLPETFLSPANEERFLPLLHEYLDKAEAHLAAGWAYTNMLPFGQFRLRLACAWPILIGARTLELLRGANVIELQQGMKVTRAEVRAIVGRSFLACPFRKIWRRLFSPTGKAVASAGDLA